MFLPLKQAGLDPVKPGMFGQSFQRHSPCSQRFADIGGEDRASLHALANRGLRSSRLQSTLYKLLRRALALDLTAACALARKRFFCGREKCRGSVLRDATHRSLGRFGVVSASEAA